MKERPILFSGPMVRALLAGRKTQTRRVVKLNVPADADEVFFWSGEDLRRKGWRNVSEPGLWARKNGRDGYIEFIGRCPYGVPGDRLWVREAFAYIGDCRHSDPGAAALAANGFYRADETVDCGDITRWRPSIHMPRRLSRITLEITEVRVERLQDISEADALAEGIEQRGIEFGVPGLWRRPEGPHSAAAAYADLWETINGSDSWAANPWVWAVSFRVES